MSRGKKTDNETIYKIMISVFTTNNLNETSRKLNIPVTTVKDIYDRNKDKEEFVKLQTEKRDEFVESATRIINKATELLDRRLQTALDNQDELDEIIEQVYDTDKKELNETQKKTIVNKIAKMQLNNLSEITTALGTLYDKKALSEGKNTVNTGINIIMDKKVEELSQ